MSLMAQSSPRFAFLGSLDLKLIEGPCRSKRAIGALTICQLTVCRTKHFSPYRKTSSLSHSVAEAGPPDGATNWVTVCDPCVPVDPAIA